MMDKDNEIAAILKQFINNECRELIDESVPVIKQPQYHKAEFSLWKDLKQCDVDALNDTQTVDELQRELAKVLELEEYLEDRRQGITVTLFTNVISFARERCFDDRQLSVLFSMFKWTHEIMQETPFSNMDQCIHFFTEMVYCHTIRRPPYSLDIFSVEEGKMVMDFAMEYYFKHFKLFKYVFTPKVKLDLKIHYEGKPVTPIPDDIEYDLELLPKKVEIKEEESTIPQQLSEEQKSEARKELQQIVENFLKEELSQLKESIEKRMKMAEVELNLVGNDDKKEDTKKSPKKSRIKK